MEKDLRSEEAEPSALQALADCSERRHSLRWNPLLGGQRLNRGQAGQPFPRLAVRNLMVMIVRGGDADGRSLFPEKRPVRQNTGREHGDQGRGCDGPAWDVALAYLISYGELYAGCVQLLRQNGRPHAPIQFIVGHRNAPLASIALVCGAKIFRNSSRARLNLDITVPMGTFKIPAISWQVNPSTTANKNTDRCSSDKAFNASAISAASCAAGRTC